MSPVLGAVASVMKVFEGFENRPKFTFDRDRAVTVRGTGLRISRAEAERK
jgi:hypothetical protein